MPFIQQLVYKCKGEIDHEPLNFVHACAHIPHRAPTPTHLHGLLKVLSGCTETVEGEVLRNHADPLAHLD